jgi:hypothetical protein
VSTTSLYLPPLNLVRQSSKTFCICPAIQPCNALIQPSNALFHSVRHTMVRYFMCTTHPAMFTPRCATEQYLQTSMQLEHACELLLQSELFAFHSERMCDNIVDEVQKVFKHDPSQNGLKSDEQCLGDRPPPTTRPLSRPPLLRTQEGQFPSHSQTMATSYTSPD